MNVDRAAKQPSLDPKMWPQITDETMNELKTLPRPYTVVILKIGPNFSMNPETMKIIREHGRRNLSMRAAGLMSIVCPVADGGQVTGVGIFNEGDPSLVSQIMSNDPGVKAGVFTFEAHPTRIFPGDCIPFRPGEGHRVGFL